VSNGIIGIVFVASDDQNFGSSAIGCTSPRAFCGVYTNKFIVVRTL
jgi:hypothetical protein